MSIPLISVIVATYDRPAFLREALDSLEAQTVEDFECIVVDDASPAPATVPDDPRFRVVRLTSNGGEAAARNAGLSAARGRYIAFLDDDDTYTPERLRLGLDGVDRAPVTVCWRAAPGGLRRVEHDLNGDVSDVILDRMTPQLGQVTIAANVAPRFDERYAGLTDVEWWLRVAHVARVATVAGVGLIYRTHDGPRNRNGILERISGSRLLLESNSEYFATHPRAAAFRWKRIGLMAGLAGDHALAKKSLGRSLLLHPAPATTYHLIRSLPRFNRSTRIVEDTRVPKP